MDSYFTLQSNIEVSGEFVDRKSRFIAQLVHIESEDEANAFIEMVRKRHYVPDCITPTMKGRLRLPLKH